ncbi:MAG: RsmD family RNA methyltransferase [Bacteroidales bacterium]|nr:RsmD family RNA methyltransferase [Bacteroidales bacterium]
MRIIGGKYKGRRIDPPSDFKARPTTDFAREGLFNILNNRIDFESVTVLDLFSGTGSISYEFASRGATSIHLIEKDMRHISGIKRIIRELDLENIKVIHIDVKAFLKTCSVKYDVVFADPPYDLRWLSDLPDLVTGSGVIKEEGFFILEHPKNLSFKDHKLFFEHRNYGGVNFSFFKPEIPDPISITQAQD